MKNKKIVGINTWGTTLGGPAAQWDKKKLSYHSSLKKHVHFLEEKNGGSMLKCIFFML